MDEDEGMAILFIVGGFVGVILLVEIKIVRQVTIASWLALIGFGVLFAVLTKAVYYPRREKK
jgi:hypothetical protein